MHGGTGNPDYGPYPTSMLLYINEVPFYSQRPFVQMLLSGVFERFPRLKFVMTGDRLRVGAAAAGAASTRSWRASETRASIGELRYGKEHMLPRSATEYFQQNVWMGVSQPGDADVAARHTLAAGRFMWGSDYPHDEGTHPYTHEHLRAGSSGLDPAELRGCCWRATLPQLYDFDLDALAPLAAKIGPTVAEVATPIDEVPTKQLERLSGDMDPKAIK